MLAQETLPHAHQELSEVQHKAKLNKIVKLALLDFIVPETALDHPQVFVILAIIAQ